MAAIDELCNTDNMEECIEDGGDDNMIDVLTLLYSTIRSALKKFTDMWKEQQLCWQGKQGNTGEYRW